MGEKKPKVVEKGPSAASSGSKIDASWSGLFAGVLWVGALAATMIGLTGGAYARFRSLERKVQDTTGLNVSFHAPGLLGTGTVVMVVSCLTVLFAIWCIAQLCFYRTGKSLQFIQQTYHSVPVFYWTAGSIWHFLGLITFGTWVAFVVYYSKTNITLYTAMPDGTISVTQLARANLMYNPNAKGWVMLGFVVGIGVLLWASLFMVGASYIRKAGTYAREEAKLYNGDRDTSAMIPARFHDVREESRQEAPRMGHAPVPSTSAAPKPVVPDVSAVAQTEDFASVSPVEGDITSQPKD